MTTKMNNFEYYTVEIYQTQESFYQEVPENRFVAFLKEIPENSLYEHGATQEEALRNLRVQFEVLRKEAAGRRTGLPAPKQRDLKKYSGKLLLRLPRWLHRSIEESATEDEVSINSYIVNRLIQQITRDEMLSYVRTCYQQLLDRATYRVSGFTSNRMPPSQQLRLITFKTTEKMAGESPYKIIEK
jgi:predicted RNase H-like HicB family nuclease